MEAMSVFHKILVPLDGSEHSDRALKAALQIAAKFDGKITLLHVYSVTVTPVVIPEPTTLNPTGVPIATSAEVSKMVDAARDAGKKILKDAELKVRAENLEVETMLREGNSSQEIVKAAKDGEFDLIVIGARGVHRIRDLLMGSVTEGVVKHASCPVLVVK
jgi:nucleotide-binding universal stress UspA family protein